MDLWDVKTTTTPTAQKEHTCNWCREPIEPGEEYERCDGIYDGRWSTYKQHKECREAELYEIEQYDRVMESNTRIGSYDRGEAIVYGESYYPAEEDE